LNKVPPNIQVEIVDTIDNSCFELDKEIYI